MIVVGGSTRTGATRVELTASMTIDAPTVLGGIMVFITAGKDKISQRSKAVGVTTALKYQHHPLQTINKAIAKYNTLGIVLCKVSSLVIC